MQILPGIHHFDTGAFNWYLVEEEGRLTLVDAGFPGHYPVFVDALQQLGKTPGDLEAIILTHSHADHTGFAARLQAETNARILVHADDRDAIARPLNLPWYGLLSNAWRAYIRSMLIHATGKGVFRGTRIRAADTFRDGDRLDIPGRPHVLHVPGHTPGEVAFMLPDRDVLISGDTLITRNLMTGEEGGPQVPHRLLNDNDAQTRRSLDRFVELGVLTMLPGHGRPWHGDIAEAVDHARSLAA